MTARQPHQQQPKMRLSARLLPKPTTRLYFLQFGQTRMNPDAIQMHATLRRKSHQIRGQPDGFGTIERGVAQAVFLQSLV